MLHFIITSTVFTSFSAVVLARQRRDLTVSISITSRNGNFMLEAPHDDVEVTNFILNLVQPEAPYRWAFSADNYNYRYVNNALADGDSTFAYDRLGIGQPSAPGEPLTEIQPWLDISSLHALTVMLRDTAVPGIPVSYKILHVGHSFGNPLTHLTFLDDTRLTGPYFGLGANFFSANELPQFANYPDGYVAVGDERSPQVDFFAPGNFDPDILTAAFESAQPITVDNF
ncbi:hypothetical protein DL767_002362 [Monosporascus sp. MG133]|nr:hypothetical protein DL767_002362 [Monosporascus sp. MG133]